MPAANGCTRCSSPSYRLLAASLAVAVFVLASCANSTGDGIGTPIGTTPSSSATVPTDGHGSFEPIEGVPGVTADSINVALLSTKQNNPLGYCILDCYRDGVEAYFAFRNSQGGVNGRQLVLSDVVDDELGSNQVKALELVDDPDVFAVIAAPIIAAGFADLAAAGIPLYTNAVPATESAAHDSIFQLTGTSCLRCASPPNVYAAKLAGGTKVGIVGYGLAQSSKDCVASAKDSLDRWGPAVGIEAVYTNDQLAFGLANGVAPEVTAMKAAGVDFLYTCTDKGGALTLQQEMQRQGMDDVRVLLPQGYADRAFVSANADLIEGDVLYLPFRPLEADVEDTQAKDFVEWTGKAGAEITDQTIDGWINADLLNRGVLAAGPQFDRAEVIAATNRITDYDAGGFIAPVDFSRQHEPPTPDDPTTHGPPQVCASFVKVAKGEFELLGDPDKPFFCWETALTAWKEPVATDFG